ncbi:type III PLP-dependent enzyme [Acinetobacter sp. ESBL14]|uniref:type III PLP-dependent enzyme n=1 Tax=Acinetobacter sp. ESBL14 TaxID=3077329 RepID=UPI002FC977A4
MFEISQRIVDTALTAKAGDDDPIALFAYDLDALKQHVHKLVTLLPESVSLYYAIKANSEKEILDTLAPVIDGFEISSGGEISKVQQCESNKPFIFSGPGKLDSDLRLAIQHGVEFIHVESLHEIQRLNQIAAESGVVQNILIRINPSLPDNLSTKLSMAGTATPFGIEETDLVEAIQLTETSPHLSLCGFHIHAMSHQTDVSKHLQLMEWYLHQWKLWKKISTKPQTIQHLNVGGGIGVNYLNNQQFDWPLFCAELQQLLARHEQVPFIRFEMGRFISAFCGYYIVQVLDIKSSHGQNFLVCRGGTHQFRLPVAQGHDHPVSHIALNDTVKNQPAKLYNIVGQLCTPKDILSRNQALSNVHIGDLLVLPLAGAYGYNISHADFLCHPRPQQIFIGG